MVEEAAGNTGDAGQDVQDDETFGTIEFFNLRSNDPERIRIEKELQKANMDKNRRDETPPIALRNLSVGLYAEGHQRLIIRASAGKRHQHEDADVHAKKD